MKHWKLSDNTKVINGITLHQVELTTDCKFGKKGDLGGWIESESSLIGVNAWLYKNAICYHSGVIRGGEIRGGVIYSGVIRGGVILGGVIWGGEIRGGEICGGVIRGGEIRGGVIRGGVILGGVIWGGEIRGGEICGGEIRGGEIRGGEIYGGVIQVSPLQIQGTRHFIIASRQGYIRIGCFELKLSEWDNIKANKADDSGYSDNEKQEYDLYVKLAIEFYKIHSDKFPDYESN